MSFEFTQSWNTDGRRFKILFLPLNNFVVRQSAVEQAFVKLGFCLYSFDYNVAFAKRGGQFVNHQLLRIVDAVKPDWIHMQIQFSAAITTDTLKKIRQRCKNTIITNWTGDIRPDPIPTFLNVAKHVDYALISNVGQIKDYKKAGCSNVEYWQVGYDQNKFRPLNENVKKNLKNRYNQDIAFCATWWPRTRFSGNGLREDVVNLLHKKYGNRFGIYGKGWKKIGRPQVGYYEQNSVYNTSKIVISISQLINIDNYYSDRQLIALASGALVISNYIKGVEEEHFVNKKNIVWFKNLNECMKLVEYYINHENEAKTIGGFGAEMVSKHHTWDCRIKELSQRVGVI